MDLPNDLRNPDELWFQCLIIQNGLQNTILKKNVKDTFNYFLAELQISIQDQKM